MTTDQHLNTGAMALDSLPENEAQDFTDHLQGCADCAAELASFLETAAILGSSVAQVPPASLRRSVMEAVAHTRQLPPITEPDAGRHRQSGVADAPVATDDGAQVLAPVIPLRRPWYRRSQSLLAAAVAVLIIGGGTTIALDRNSSTAPSASACVAAAADKSVLSPSVGSGGTVTLAPSCDTAIVSVPALPAAPSGKVYQLWVIKSSGATSVGTLTSGANGTYPAVAASVHAGDSKVGLTVEPAPGSKAPTSNPFWVVDLTS